MMKKKTVVAVEEINEDDLEDVSYEEDDVISGQETSEGTASFTWKGKEYEVCVTVIEYWDRHGGDSKTVEIEQPNGLDFTDEEWDYIAEQIELEIK